jgi:hypothetical protein
MKKNRNMKNTIFMGGLVGYLKVVFFYFRVFLLVLGLWLLVLVVFMMAVTFLCSANLV